MKRWVIAAVVALLCAAPGAGWTKSTEVLPFDIEVQRLENGLTVAFVPFPSPGVAAYYTAMRVGSRDEVEPGHTGFAHLFEHMMFRGTKTYPGEVYEKTVQSLGADSSAWTWNDQTVYYFVAPKAALKSIIELEADRFRNLHYTEEDFKTESGAVFGEYNKNFSNPLNKMDEILMDTAFTEHTYKHTTMGFLEDIRAMPTMFEYSRKFFKRYYVPKNGIITIAGDFDKEQALAWIRDAYGSWRGERYRPPIPVEPLQQAERRVHHDWHNPTLPRMLLGYHVPAYSCETANTAALVALGEMVFGPAGELYKELVLEERIVEELEWWNWQLRDPHLFIVSVVLKKEGAFDEVLARFDGALADLVEGGVEEDKLEATKSHYRYKALLGFETAKDVAESLSFYATLDGDPRSLDRFLGRMAEVGSGAVRGVAQSYLVPSNRTVVTLSHGTANEGGGE